MSEESLLSNYCIQTFATLDKWLNQAGAEKGDQALSFVKIAFENNLKANATYYEQIAIELESKGEQLLALKNKVLAKLYRGLM